MEETDPVADTILIVKLRLMLALWIATLMGLAISPLSFKLKLHTQGPIHGWLHYGVFVTTAVLLWLSFPGRLTRAVAFLAGCGLALLQEWAENWIYHAGFEYKDVAYDVAGLVTGFALMILMAALATTQQRPTSYRDY